MSRPSIALGILSSLFKQRGIQQVCWYPHPDFAATLGVHRSENVSDTRSLYSLSEHLFAADLFGPQAVHSDDILVSSNRMPGMPCPDEGSLARLRDQLIPDFVSHLAARVRDLGLNPPRRGPA